MYTIADRDKTANPQARQPCGTSTTQLSHQRADDRETGELLSDTTLCSSPTSSAPTTSVQGTRPEDEQLQKDQSPPYTTTAQQNKPPEKIIPEEAHKSSETILPAMLPIVTAGASHEELEVHDSSSPQNATENTSVTVATESVSAGNDKLDDSPLSRPNEKVGNVTQIPSTSGKATPNKRADKASANQATKSSTGTTKGKKRGEKKTVDKPRKKRGDWRVQNYNSATVSAAPGYYYSGPHDPAFRVPLPGPAPGYPVGVDAAMPGPTAPSSANQLNQVASPSINGMPGVSPGRAYGPVHDEPDSQMSSPSDRPQLSPLRYIPQSRPEDPTSAWTDDPIDYDMSMDDLSGTGETMDIESRPITPVAKPKVRQISGPSPAPHVRLATIPKNTALGSGSRVSHKPYTVDTELSMDLDIDASALHPSLRPAESGTRSKAGPSHHAQQMNALTNAAGPSKPRKIAPKPPAATQQNIGRDAFELSHHGGALRIESHTKELVTAIIEDRRPEEIDECIVELTLSLKSLEVTSGYCTDAVQICSALQEGPSRIDGMFVLFPYPGLVLTSAKVLQKYTRSEDASSSIFCVYTLTILTTMDLLMSTSLKTSCFTLWLNR